MYNANMQSGKVEQTSQTSQGYGLERCKKCKTDITIPYECEPSKIQGKENLVHGSREG